MAGKPDDIAYVYEPREGAFVVGVPQRDLTNADVEAIGASVHEAVATGLYRKAKGDEKSPPQPAQEAPAVKDEAER